MFKHQKKVYFSLKNIAIQLDDAALDAAKGNNGVIPFEKIKQIGIRGKNGEIEEIVDIAVIMSKFELVKHVDDQKSAKDAFSAAFSDAGISGTHHGNKKYTKKTVKKSTVASDTVEEEEEKETTEKAPEKKQFKRNTWKKNTKKSTQWKTKGSPKDDSEKKPADEATEAKEEK